MSFSNGLPKYAELSPAGRAKLVDARVLQPRKGPKWLHKADLCELDYNYAAGYTDADRRWANNGLYVAMLKDISRLPWWDKPVAWIQAFLYYLRLRLFAKEVFNGLCRPNNLDEMIEMHRVR